MHNFITQMSITYYIYIYIIFLEILLMNDNDTPNQIDVA